MVNQTNHPPPTPAAPTATQQQQQQPTLIGQRRAGGDAAFREKLAQMALPLAPLVQLTTGAVHPAFPGTLLSFWLLTDAELEQLAHFYHQRTPCRWTYHYPCPVPWSSDVPLEEKRRRIGRFIGLRGCESPVLAVAAAPVSEDDAAAQAIRDEARAARLRNDEEEIWRRKLRWYN
ncbi:hypothetical protein GGR52DRAFT_571249 [Hypoxylon sp. FL1284]|nr:hypothetical protein GGR52DRAFT_571249 [Hypoxylon sp. FL1284]